jgi:carbon storage regulator CsrA
MLVLTRKEGERLFIDGDIVITVVKVSTGGVSLGITAPADIPVEREEIVNSSPPPERMSRIVLAAKVRGLTDVQVEQVLELLR